MPEEAANVVQNEDVTPAGGPLASPLRDRPDRRGQIVAAAATVLGRDGYASTTLKQVAREAGIAPGLLHYYFQTKEELLVEVVSTMDEEMREEWRAALEGIADPLERMTAGFDLAVELCAKKPEFFRMLFDLYAAGQANPAIEARARELTENFISEIRKEVETISSVMPAPLPADETVYDLPTVLAAAVDGIAFLSMIQGRDPAPAYRAFKLLLLSAAAMSYMIAGQTPPLEALTKLLGAPLPFAPAGVTSSSTEPVH